MACRKSPASTHKGRHVADVAAWSQDATNQHMPHMAVDPNARKLTLSFPGGSLTATRGLLTSLFGPGLIAAESTGTATVSVKAHQRVRVIGGPAKNIAANSYTRTKYPSGTLSGSAGGESIAIFDEGDWWTARLSGSHQDFNAFLEGATWASNKTINWRSEKGKPYGPFVPQNV